MRHCLGRPLPHQQADTPRTDPRPPELWHMRHATRMHHPVLAAVSHCYPRVQGTLSTCFSPIRRFPPLSLAREWLLARLACIKHAASVRPEPASNSPLKEIPHHTVML